MTWGRKLLFEWSLDLIVKIEREAEAKDSYVRLNLQERYAARASQSVPVALASLVSACMKTRDQVRRRRRWRRRGVGQEGGKDGKDKDGVARKGGEEQDDKLKLFWCLLSEIRIGQTTRTDVEECKELRCWISSLLFPFSPPPPPTPSPLGFSPSDFS